MLSLVGGGTTTKQSQTTDCFTLFAETVEAAFKIPGPVWRCRITNNKPIQLLEKQDSRNALYKVPSTK